MATELVNVDKKMVYQSNKLIEASYSLTVLEQKLIRLLASMIQKEDTDFKEYEFKAIDLARIFNINVKNIYKELDSITNKLMGKYVVIRDDAKQKFKKRHLIDTADFESGILKLKINSDMRTFYLELKNNYTGYELKNILQFKSSYSFRFYEFFKQYQSLKQRTLSIENIRTYLNIGKEEYPRYANLKQKVIKVAVDEINKKTDLQIDFTDIKEGRSVVSIKFVISSQSKIVKQIERQKTPLVVLIEGNELITTVQRIFIESITELDAKKILKAANDNLDVIKEKYELAKQSKRIKNIMAWMIRAIKEDYKKPKEKVKVDSFNDFEQRNYDYDDLEKKLLGWDTLKKEEKDA